MLKAILGNKVLWYMCSRYMTYILQFVTTLIIAITLGPESFGIWSFLLLIINFFNIVDFGISNSLSVLLVQDKLNIVNSKKNLPHLQIPVNSLIVPLSYLSISCCK